MERLIGYKFAAEIYDLVFVKSPNFFTNEPIPVEIMEEIVTAYVRDKLEQVNDDFETAFGINEITDFIIIATDTKYIEEYPVTFKLDNMGEIQTTIMVKNNSRFLGSLKGGDKHERTTTNIFTHDC